MTASEPQTIEAINHTKAAGVPMIVAINKIDKPGANPQKVREELLQHEIVVEDMGGEVQDVRGFGAEEDQSRRLLEAIQLQAEILELKANPDRPAEGAVVEAKLDKGRGPLATVLVQRGTLRVGDIFVVGPIAGKVRAMIDDKGRQVKEAGPSVPVEVLGLSGVPSAGDTLTVVENEARAREVAAYRQGVLDRKRTTSAPANFDTMFSALKEKQAVEFPAGHQGRRAGLGRGDRQRGQQDLERRHPGPRAPRRASAASPRATSPSPRPRARRSSASTSAPTPRRARSPSATVSPCNIMT